MKSAASRQTMPERLSYATCTGVHALADNCTTSTIVGSDKRSLIFENRPTSNAREASDLADRLDRIQRLVDQLARVQGDAIQQQSLSERIHREIQSAKLAMLPIKGV
jgi:hypothetical protein